ncbi:glycosyltransferase [bacterium]|nr:glycosyltransferase [bacterium]
MKVLVVFSGPDTAAFAGATLTELLAERHDVFCAAPLDALAGTPDGVAQLPLSDLQNTTLMNQVSEIETLIAKHAIARVFFPADVVGYGAFIAARRMGCSYGLIRTPGEASLKDDEAQLWAGVIVPGASEVRGALMSGVNELAQREIPGPFSAHMLQTIRLLTGEAQSGSSPRDLQTELAELRAELEKKDAQYNYQTMELDLLKSSIFWLMFTRWRRLRNRLMPPESRRDRLWILGTKVIKLWASYGLVSGVRALGAKAAKAVYRRTLLPLRFKQELQQILTTTPHKGVVIYPPTVDWGWMFQRPHHLMSQFAKQGYLCFFVSPMSRGDSFEGFKKVQDNLYLCSDISLLYEIERPLYLISWTAQTHHIDRMKNPQVIYDYLDALEVSTDGEVSTEKIRAHHSLLQRADVVVATARKLLEETKPLRPDVTLVPNGVQPADFSVEPSAPIPEDMREIRTSGRPIIGYYGAMAKWFDYELLEFAAQAMPEAQFVLLGPDYDGTISELADRPNIHYLGLKQYHELKHYLHHFDVAIIPFRINAITKATSPVKLFEYMAGGKPIVTTALNEAYYYKSVFIGETPDAFVAKLREALIKGKDPRYLELLAKEMQENTWEKRALSILAALAPQPESPAPVERIEVSP